jgi:hypothetical protein
MLVAAGLGAPGQVAGNTDLMNKAYEMGKRLAE